MTYPPHAHDGRTNPLSRLLTVLRHVRNTAEFMVDDDKPAGRIWMNALDLKNTGQLEAEIALLLSDLERFRLLTEASQPPDLALYLRQITRARSALLSVRSATWGEYYAIMNEPLFDSLSLLSNLADHYAAELTLSDQEAAEFRSRIARLLKDISASSLPSQLKQQLIAGLFSLHHALTEHQIHGSYALRDALDLNIGLAFRHQRTIEAITSAHTKRFLQPWTTLLADLFRSLASTLDTPELPDAAVQALLHLTSGK